MKKAIGLSERHHSVRREVSGEKKLNHSNWKLQVCTDFQDQVVFPNLAASEITRAVRISIAAWAAFSTSVCFYSNTFRKGAGGGTWHYNFPLSPKTLKGREKLHREPSVWFKQE